MKNWLGATLICMVLSGSADIYAAQIPPVPEHPRWAQTTLGVNLKTWCPDLRMADEGTIAVVVFWLSSSGIASRISVKSSSGSNALDSAAISCVSRLPFAVATALGTGDPIDSWQQVAFRWADQSHANETQAMTSQNPLAMASSASVPIAGALKSQDDSSRHANSVTVHACVDETGRLKQDPTIVHSSGVVSLDQAAVRIAASGSAYYRPDTSSSGPPVSGCAELVINFDTK